MGIFRKFTGFLKEKWDSLFGLYTCAYSAQEEARLLASIEEYKKAVAAETPTFASAELGTVFFDIVCKERVKFMKVPQFNVVDYVHGRPLDRVFNAISLDMSPEFSMCVNKYNVEDNKAFRYYHGHEVLELG